MDQKNTTRTLSRVIAAMATSDGAGVKLRRSLGQSAATRLDPFLMLDEFASEDPDDYIAGFPDHPHRGFETVTYMLEGHMLHQDHMGNEGHLRSGDVQWMTAGRGIIHSETPQQQEGQMRGFQLWINLPAKEKMKPAHYRDIAAADIPVVHVAHGVTVKVIAGELRGDGGTTPGAVTGVTTEPIYFDVHLAAGARFTHALPDQHHAFVYPYEGQIVVGDHEHARVMAIPGAGVLSPGTSVEIGAHDGPARFLLLAARPIGEPVVQYGPFVMNTREEIEQAVRDFQAGRLESSEARPSVG